LAFHDKRQGKLMRSSALHILPIDKPCENVSGNPLDHCYAHGIAKTSKRLIVAHCNWVTIWNALQARIFSRRHCTHADASPLNRDQELLSTSPNRRAQTTGSVAMAYLRSLPRVSDSPVESPIRFCGLLQELLNPRPVGGSHHVEMARYFMLRPPAWKCAPVCGAPCGR